MVRHIRKSALAILSLILLLASCTSQKAVQKQEEIYVDTSSISGMSAITPDTVALQHISSNTELNLIVDGRKISLKGKLRIKRGEGIQISITPLGLVEAACIEFLPQKIRFINKLLKTYTEVPYYEASAIGLSGIKYNVLEAIFLNHAFLPDGRPAYNGLDEMRIEDKDGCYHLYTKGDTSMKYDFSIEKSSGNLVSCNGLSSTGESIRCDYSDFRDIDDVSFPNEICISFKGDTSVTLEFELKKTNNKSFNFSSRSVNSSYRQQNVGDFIKTFK